MPANLTCSAGARARLWLAALLVLACMPAWAVQHLQLAWRAQQGWPGTTVSGPFLSPGHPLPLPAVSGMQLPDEQAWSSVTLPDADARELQADVHAPRGAEWVWYRVAIDCVAWARDRRAPAHGLDDPMVVYVPRAPNGGLHLFWQAPSGHWTLLHDQRGQGAEVWNQPVWWALPDAQAQQTDQACAGLAASPEPGAAAVQLALALPHAQGTPRALSSIWLGPGRALRPRWAARVGLQQTLPQVVSLTIVVLGLFTLGAWWRQRQESSYLLFSLCALVWALRNLHLWWPVPDDAVWAGWFWWLAKATPPWFLVLTFCFAYRFMPWRYPRVERALLGLAVALTVVAMPWLQWPVETTLVEYGLVLGVAAVSTSVMTRDAWRAQASREFRLLTVLFWLGLAFGLHDVLMLLTVAPVESVMLVPLITLGFTGADLYALHRRHLGTLDELAALNQDLVQRVAVQRQDIERSHARLRDAEQAETRINERQRLMRDMHDGVGSSLITALAIESMEPSGQDLGLLLGSLRHRLGKRLVLAGLQVDWDVGPLPQLAWLQPTDALQFLRLLQEALTNVIKHAQATQLRVGIHHDDKDIVVRVEDNGRGMDVRHRGNGHGLLNMASRARRMGGRLAVDSAPGLGTRVILQLPVVREADAAWSWRQAS